MSEHFHVGACVVDQIRKEYKQLPTTFVMYCLLMRDSFMYGFQDVEALRKHQSGQLQGHHEEKKQYQTRTWEDTEHCRMAL